MLRLGQKRASVRHHEKTTQHVRAQRMSVSAAQSFNVEVDAFFDNALILIGANANLSSVSKNIPHKNIYNASNSLTFIPVNGNISFWDLKAHKAQDVLNIGSLSATIKSFAVGDTVPYFLKYYPIDGLLGLSPIKKSYYNISVVADDLVDQLDKPLISIYTNSTRSGNGTGEVTLGAEDSDNCQNTWSYVPALDYFTNSTPFAVHVSSAEVTIGGQLTTFNLDTNVTFLPWPMFDVPIKVKDAFVNGTGATYNNSIGEYTIDCDTTKAPLITLNLGGAGNSTDSTSRKLVLSGADYIRYSIREGVCYLGVNFYSTINNQWYLGSQVLKNHCISFNYKERTVGFADSKTPKTDATKA
ncbi:eukaryotic aspartyl protease domain-containing protein [Ditylenchus destructor]|uniref:Eukaryotic aspartyl protease domain-containing protein n=1 Tax=Ditylenchus destructor TaxID=166010 RepID=A0AAD4MJ25_9BILA|nr:eukaryotic aspartyl protease domain-containing protein [Ditylenchus destructor]